MTFTPRPENDARLSIVLDSDSPYYSDFLLSNAGEAVYMHGHDALFGPIVAVIYKSPGAPPRKLSSIFISQHGTSGFLNMTIGPSSRFYSACENLAPQHKNSLVRQALAITALRTFATMSKQTRSELFDRALSGPSFDWDETVAGSLASSMKLMSCRFPAEIGQMIKKLGVIEPKHVRCTLVDVIYEDSDSTINQNNELVYLFGSQLEQLFDPLNEYSPEPTELLYSPPLNSNNTPSRDSDMTATVCDELFQLQSHFREALVKFLQEFLIPLRVKVLGGEIPGMTIRKLNTIFPPTVDEIVRVNTIFYEALEAARPYGSFEVIKACGMTIPYFYKACMRHEAASKNFSRNLNYHYPTLERYFRKFSIQKVENIIHCSIHLTKIKLILDRLVETKLAEHTWSAEARAKAETYYQSAAGTIDAFGRETDVKAYDRRVFTPTGKILVEVAHNWPKELEYGWINRRIVTIFDGLSVTDKDDHHIVIIFTDYVVILKKAKGGEIPGRKLSVHAAGTESANETLSNVHTPSIADQILHSMMNEMPLYNVPELEVVGWAHIGQVIFAEHEDKSLAMATQGSDLGFKMYQIDSQSQLKSADIVELSVKARIMNKTQPFHLFKSEKPRFKAYATVHELQGYLQEIHKCPIAVFMNVNVGPEVLDANNLQAAFSVQFTREDELQEINVIAFSKLGYEVDRSVSPSEFREFMLGEISYLETLILSCSNNHWKQAFIDNNATIADFLVKYGTTPSGKKSHYSVDKEGRMTKRAEQDPVVLLSSEDSPTSAYFQLRDNHGQSHQHDVPAGLLSAIEQSQQHEFDDEDAASLPQDHHYFDHHNLSPPHSRDMESVISAIPSPSASLAPSLSISRTPSPAAFEQQGKNVSSMAALHNKKSMDHLRARYGNIASDDEDYISNSDEIGWEDVSEFPSSRQSAEDFMDTDDERQAREVEEWYQTLSREDDDNDSLSSDIEEDDFTTPMVEQGAGFDDDNSAYQIGMWATPEQSHRLEEPPVPLATMERDYSSGQFSMIRKEFGFSSTPVRKRGSSIQSEGTPNSSATDKSNPESGDTLLVDEDFSYLAGFVGI